MYLYGYLVESIPKKCILLGTHNTSLFCGCTEGYPKGTLHKKMNIKKWHADSEHPDIILEELMLIYFEWIGSHEVTDACAKEACALLSLLLAGSAEGSSKTNTRRMLTAINDRTVVAIDICPNRCIAYYDAKQPTGQHHQHVHRTRCPHCGADRHITHKNGTVRAAKKGYYLPCGAWFHDLFKIDRLGQ